MGQAGNHIVEGQYGIATVVLTCAVGAQHRAKDAENAHKVQGSLLDPALGDGGQGNGNELDTAKKQRQIVKPIHGVVGPETHQNDLKKFKTVDQKSRPDQHPVFLPGQGVFDFDTFIRQLKDVGFDGALLIEVYEKDYQDAKELKISCDYVDELLYKHGCLNFFK
jgi:hypothetical protein